MFKQCFEARYTSGATAAVIDARNTEADSGSKGGLITEDILEEAATNVVEAFGRVSHVFMPMNVKKDLNKVLSPAKRLVDPTASGQLLSNHMLGLPAAGYVSDMAYQFDDHTEPHMKFIPSLDVFFPSGESDEMKAPAADYPSSTVAPGDPDSVTVTVNAPTVSGSLFGTGDAGEYFYKVSSISSAGITNATAGDTSVTVAAAGSVSVSIAFTETDITGFTIYRSAMDASDNSDCRWIANVAVGTTPAVYTDLNRTLPGTSVVFMLSCMPRFDAIDYRQLMPFVRIPLAFGLTDIVGYPYLYMLYRYLRLSKLINPRASNKTYHVMVSNIRAEDSEF